MSRARRRRPDVRSAVRRAASRRAVGAGQPTAGKTGETLEGQAPGSASSGRSRLAFLLDGASGPTVPTVPTRPTAPSASPRSASAEPAPTREPIRVRSAPRPTGKPGRGEGAGPDPVWASRPAPHYRGDRDEQTTALVADPEDAWSALPAPLQTVLGVAIALPLAAAVALTRFAASLAGVGRS